MNLIENFEKLLAAGKDNAMLRLGLGTAYFQAGDLSRAVIHLEKAVEQDPTYSAAWKVLAKALVESGRKAEAIQAYALGIACAEEKGDVQAAKEMRVFLRRLEKSPGKE